MTTQNFDGGNQGALGERGTGLGYRGAAVMAELFRVLLADDVADLRYLIKMAFDRTESFEVVAEAEDGIEAVEMAARHKPDLVILDVSMPRQDGLESLPKILEASPKTKVIVLSGFQAERLEKAALDLGAVSYLEKGAPPAELISAAQKALSSTD